MGYISTFLADSIKIINQIDQALIDKAICLLSEVRERRGRLFFVGVGGSAANCSHAVNDFRKIAGIESYAPTDNVAELTARTNDEGWETTFAAWLHISHISSNDALFVLSVGGGNKERNVSLNIVEALDEARAAGAKIIGIVGRDGGYTAKVADACIIVPVIDESTVTPQTEAFQAVIWHLMVTDPRMKQSSGKWESLGNAK
ncbi:MAG: SIS domain-containing protein [Sterolibacteriaceae bacterium MAG5]|nr:SIS domain-containing protein [Candidatus Nitricoxidireducens bremensis]